MTILDDSAIEEDETFHGLLLNFLGEPAVLNPDTAVVTIIDANDSECIKTPEYLGISLDHSQASQLVLGKLEACE